jgi:hypothetical protein
MRQEKNGNAVQVSLKKEQKYFHSRDSNSVSRVRAKYPNQLNYNGFAISVKYCVYII